jgi:hypothetical protein
LAWNWRRNPADHVLVTADFDPKAAVQDAKIEFLPRK